MSSTSYYVVSGATRNIGLEFTKALATRPGAKVFGLTRSIPTFEIPNVEWVKCDSTLPSMQAAVSHIQSTTKSIEILVNNAAIANTADLPLGEGKEAELRDSILESLEVNSVAPLLLTSLLLPLLRKGQEKRIYNMTSANGVQSFIQNYGPAMGGRYPYSLSKGALTIFTCRLSQRLKPEGFIVVAVSPEAVIQRDLDGKPLIDPEILNVGVRRIFGNDFEGVIEAEESVKRMLGWLDTLKPEDTGKIYRQSGKEM